MPSTMRTVYVDVVWLKALLKRTWPMPSSPLEPFKFLIVQIVASEIVAKETINMGISHSI